MKKNIIIVITVLILTLWGCEKEEAIKEQKYLFLKQYCARVTVGGFVGMVEKCFEIGDVVVGYESAKGTITIRITQPSSLNETPKPQEFLDVSSSYLELKE